MTGTGQKVAIVTGGSQGIGAGLVGGYRQRGWAVVANSRDIKPSKDPDVLTVEGDVSEQATADQIISQALDRFGRVDTLVNNAGVFVAKPFTDYTAEDYALVTGVNLAGFFWLTQRAIGQMLKQRGGHVVNISASIADRADSVEPTALTALTKGGLAAVTKSLAVEYASRGIRVNAVAPGIIQTPLHAGRVLHARGARGETAPARARGPGQRHRGRHPVPGVSAVRHRRDPAHRRRPDRLAPGCSRLSQSARWPRLPERTSRPLSSGSLSWVSLIVQRAPAGRPNILPITILSPPILSMAIVSLPILC